MRRIDRGMKLSTDHGWRQVWNLLNSDFTSSFPEGRVDNTWSVLVSREYILQRLAPSTQSTSIINLRADFLQYLLQLKKLNPDLGPVSLASNMKTLSIQLQDILKCESDPDFNQSVWERQFLGSMGHIPGVRLLSTFSNNEQKLTENRFVRPEPWLLSPYLRDIILSPDFVGYGSVIDLLEENRLIQEQLERDLSSLFKHLNSFYYIHVNWESASLGEFSVHSQVELSAGIWASTARLLAFTRVHSYFLSRKRQNYLRTKVLTKFRPALDPTKDHPDSKAHWNNLNELALLPTFIWGFHDAHRQNDIYHERQLLSGTKKRHKRWLFPRAYGRSAPGIAATYGQLLPLPLSGQNFNTLSPKQQEIIIQNLQEQLSGGISKALVIRKGFQWNFRLTLLIAIIESMKRDRRVHRSRRPTHDRAIIPNMNLFKQLYQNVLPWDYLLSDDVAIQSNEFTTAPDPILGKLATEDLIDAVNGIRHQHIIHLVQTLLIDVLLDKSAWTESSLQKSGQRWAKQYLFEDSFSNPGIAAQELEDFIKCLMPYAEIFQLEQVKAYLVDCSPEQLHRSTLDVNGYYSLTVPRVQDMKRGKRAGTAARLFSGIKAVFMYGLVEDLINHGLLPISIDMPRGNVLCLKEQSVVRLCKHNLEFKPPKLYVTWQQLFPLLDERPSVNMDNKNFYEWYLYSNPLRPISLNWTTDRGYVPVSTLSDCKNVEVK